MPYVRKLMLGVVAGLAGWIATPAHAELMYFTNGSSISRADSSSLGTVTTVAVTGLVNGGETLVDIDVRPNPTAPGVQSLYAISSFSRMYVINPLTGLAIPIGSAGAFTINGTAFGGDFNPIVDRYRFVSNTQQNLRFNPNDGTLSGTDTALNPAGTIVAAAYDRNYVRLPGDVTPTTLFGIDSAAGTLVRIGSADGTPNSPNTGIITAVGSLGLGTNLNQALGFDVSGTGASAANPNGTGGAFATITTGGISRLYTINLTTGAATLSSSNGGAIGSGTTPFLGIATAAAPEPGTIGLLGLAVTAGLIRRRRRQVA
jgi:hypothetical protein